jgi:hypothetical protein
MIVVRSDSEAALQSLMDDGSPLADIYHVCELCQDLLDAGVESRTKLLKVTPPPPPPLPFFSQSPVLPCKNQESDGISISARKNKWLLANLMNTSGRGSYKLSGP